MSVVLVTGGAGYVGSHAVLALAAAGDDVVVYDDLSAGHAEAVEQIQRAFPARSISLVRGDILEGPRLTKTLREHGATTVMHFAARLLVGESVGDPLGYYRVNVTGTLTVLGAMAAAGVKRFVFSSTAATFGEPQTTPIDETHPQRPINPYGETKLAVERALPHIEKAVGIRWMALRYFNASGADPAGRIGEDHDPEEHLIPRALAAVAGGPPLTLFGDDYPTPDGTCIRDFIHVADLADAHVAALRALEAGAPSSAYNLGNGQGVSVRQLVESVERTTGQRVPHTVGPRRPGDPARLVASSERIRRELQWRPRLAALDDIVRTAWAWHRRHPRGYEVDETWQD
ncbi:MAG TPA: UDP-glucose 4-epimerase GalE [Vicinamibacterales bacterium]|nr:UDP-glucose 4-epimerase GalE [Vicinamibacterales bacterium]